MTNPTLLTACLLGALLGCQLAPSRSLVPDTPVAPASDPPTLARHDSGYDLAAGYCETLGRATGMVLHETPELDSGLGVRCVLDWPASEPWLCTENLGAKLQGANPYAADGTTVPLCAIPVLYDWAHYWLQ